MSKCKYVTTKSSRCSTFVIFNFFSPFTKAGKLIHFLKHPPPSSLRPYPTGDVAEHFSASSNVKGPRFRGLPGLPVKATKGRTAATTATAIQILCRLNIRDSKCPPRCERSASEACPSLSLSLSLPPFLCPTHSRLNAVSRPRLERDLSGSAGSILP